MLEGFLTDIAMSIILSGIMAIIMMSIKQPLIIGYIIAGVILGPGMGFGIVQNRENIELISEIGLIFLLFIIGLEINLKDMISSGKRILFLTLSQVIIGCLISFFSIKYFLNGSFTLLETIYLTFCINLTSTLIVVKILKDKFETQTLAAKLTIGILIFQDFFAIMFLAFQKDFLHPQYSLFLKSFFYTLLLLFISFNFSRYVFSKIIHSNSKSVEFVIILSVAYCFLVSTVANLLGLSKEMGALIAGISIANSPYSEEIVVRISSVRDFFVTLFFVSLGLKLPQISANTLFFSFIIMMIILISRFLSILPYYKIMKLGIRPLFITSLNLFPVSEFSLVITALGLGYSHISRDVVTLVLIAMILSSVISTYLINYNHRIYSLLAGVFKLDAMDEALSENEEKTDILILGYNRITHELVKNLKEKNPLMKILVADFNAGNSETIKMLGGKWIYADLSNYQSLSKLEKHDPSIIISPLSNIILKGTNTNQLLLNIKSIFPKSSLIFTADSDEEYEKLVNLGAKAINISKISSQKISREITYIARKLTNTQRTI